MLTCENCIHSSVCTPYNTPNDEYPNIGDCPHFKNKADYVEVVYCNECKFEEDCTKQMVHTTRNYVLEQNISTYNKVAFCSYGERKDK